MAREQQVVISARVDPGAARVIDAAAGEVGVSRSELLRTAALDTARRVLASTLPAKSETDGSGVSQAGGGDA